MVKPKTLLKKTGTSGSQYFQEDIPILILLFIISSSGSTLALLGVLSLNAAGATTTIWRAKGEVDVLLAVQADHERGDVHHLLADTEGKK